jgi:hypothetical protein
MGINRVNGSKKETLQNVTHAFYSKNEMILNSVS